MNKKELGQNLKKQGFGQQIINAFELVPREEFVLPEFKESAYDDTALPLINGQTISQPSTIAFMLSKLEVGQKQKILEVGSGSGYVLALLFEISPKSKIIGMERDKSLFFSSKKLLFKLGYSNARIIWGNGSKGLKTEAPFDRIIVSASANKVPKELLAQLNNEGILVIPIQDSILRIVKKNNKFETEEFKGFAFVPLIENKPTQGDALFLVN